MDKLDFHFSVHCHQPVGNFDGVFRDAYEKSYKPLIRTLLRHPAVRFGLHISGPVWDWIIANEPAFITDIERLAGRDQVELISGGYYEPILEVLNQQDAAGQIALMNQFIRTRFKQNPRGIWLTERVWDPFLPVLLSDLGIRYTTVDDTHFYYAGLEEKDIHGCYITERAGHPLYLFPIQKQLRYAIPFKEPAQVIDILQRYRDSGTIHSVTYADDGEKFGLWPGTYAWVFEQGWLERFFTELEKHTSWLNITPQGEELTTRAPVGRIHLPSASYEEMLDWALPPDAGTKFRLFKASLESAGIDTRSNPFVRGGFWDNFLVKYPESNWMHKRMLQVSAMLATMEARMGFQLDDARRELFKSQSNCVYWHGLFGGVYLNYLRHAVYEHLLKAEGIIDGHRSQPHGVAYSSLDIDLDGEDEIVLKNKHLSVYLGPSKGGALLELDVRDHNFNITNVMTRRKEAYHDLITQQQANQASADAPVTIHGRVHVKEDNLEQKLIYDWHPRYSFVEHFLPREVVLLDRLYRNDYQDLGDFTLERHDLLKQEGNIVFLSREGHLLHDSRSVPLRMEKNYRLFEQRLEAGYRLTNNSDIRIETEMLVELNLTLLATDDQRTVVLNGPAGRQTRGMADFIESAGIESFELLDAWQKMGIKISTPSVSAVLAYPLETVSASESGFERTYQGTCFMLVYDLDMEPGESRGITIPVDFYDTVSGTSTFDWRKM